VESLSAESERVLAIAAEEAVGLRHDFTGTEHILLGLLACEDAVAAPLLVTHGIVGSEVRAQLAGAGGVAGSGARGSQSLTARAKQVLTLAGREAEVLADDTVRPEHLLLGIIRQATGVAALVLRDRGVDLAELRDDVLEAREAHGAVLMDTPPVAGGRERVAVDGALLDVAVSADGPNEAPSGPRRDVVPPVCPSCSQQLTEVLAAATIVPVGSTASGRRRSLGNVTVIYCGACGHTLTAAR
jgi:hypothetical protein